MLHILSAYKRDQWLMIAMTILVLLALAVAYQPIMFNFFCSDDFYIIGWLDHCKQNISLLFQTVYEGTPYYRPLLNIFLFVEYFLFGPNSIFFRAFSLLCLLITAYILRLLVAEFAGLLKGDNLVDEKDKKTKWASTNWCFFSTALFLLFPLHTEPINWLVCTTEVLANLFILSSFLLYIYWRKTDSWRFQLSSCILCACALLIKEVAVILPVLLFVYELLVQSEFVSQLKICQPKDNQAKDSRAKNNQAKNNQPKNNQLKDNQAEDSIGKHVGLTANLALLGRTLVKALRRTAYYWLLLVCYLCLRKTMTGAFLGDINTAAFHFTDNQMMFKAWLQSLKMIVMPISSAAFGQTSLIRLAWLLMIIDLCLLTVASAYKNRAKILVLSFLICWFFLSLLPMARLLLITPDLLDARYGYLASVPLCIFLSFGLATRNKPRNLSSLRYLIFAVVIIFCCFVLRSNNLCWAEAGHSTNKMLEGFRTIHKQIPNTSKIYFLNIPFKFKGVAIAGIKVIDSMNRRPFADDDYDNCIWLKEGDQSLSTDLNTANFKAGKVKAHFYYLDRVDKSFHPVTDLQTEKVKGPIDLGMAKQIPEQAKQIPAYKNTFLFSPAELYCQSCDALVFNVDIKRKGPGFKDQTVRLAFKNTINQNNDEEEFVLAPPIVKEGQQKLIFLLRGIPTWIFGGRCSSIELSFPKNLDVEVLNASALTINKVSD